MQNLLTRFVKKNCPQCIVTILNKNQCYKNFDWTWHTLRNTLHHKGFQKVSHYTAPNPTDKFHQTFLRKVFTHFTQHAWEDTAFHLRNIASSFCLIQVLTNLVFALRWVSQSNITNFETVTTSVYDVNSDVREPAGRYHLLCYPLHFPAPTNCPISLSTLAQF